MSRQTPKLCLGCNSYTRYCNVFYLGNKYRPHRRIFRERFCPCTTCIVKPTCQDPKVIYLSLFGRRPKHKCKKMWDALSEFKEYIKVKGLRETRMKRKRRKKARA
jgi:hypothetical protein